MTRPTRIFLRRARRPVLILVAIPLVLLALRLAWGAYADHRLTQARRAAAARGHRVTPEQFTQAPIPEDQNAAPLILQAARTLHLTTVQADAIHGTNHNASLSSTQLRWSESELADIRAAAAANGGIFDLLDRAAEHPAVVWGEPGTGDYARVQLLARFLSATAIVAHQDGRTGTALARIHQINHIAARLTRNRSMLSHLVAISCADVAAADAERLHAALTIPAGSPQAQMARTLIADFLQDDSYDAQRLSGMEFEVANAKIFAQREGFGTQSWLIRPAFILAWARSYHQQLAFIDSIRARCWRAVPPPPVEVEESNLDRVTMRELMATNACRRGVLLSYRAMTDRHAAAVLLAAALYRADHDGQNTPTLEALIPQYLPAIPLDSFTFPLAPLHYHATPDLLVWSVGEDGIDDHGSTERRSTHQFGRWGARDATYGPFALEPLPTPSAPPGPPGILMPPGPPGFSAPPPR